MFARTFRAVWGWVQALPNRGAWWEAPVSAPIIPPDPTVNTTVTADALSLFITQYRQSRPDAPKNTYAPFVPVIDPVVVSEVVPTAVTADALNLFITQYRQVRSV